MNDQSQAGTGIKVGVTGAHGFVGKHTVLALKHEGCEVVEAGRETFADASKLAEFVRDVDVIVHLAGANRGEVDEVAKANVELAWSLVWACEAARVNPQIIYSSSTQEDADNPYGASKREAGEVLMDWARRNDTIATTLVVPNVFGPGCKPFYNSVVATFCHMLGRRETPEVQVDKELELIWVGDLAAEITDYVISPNDETGRVRIHGELKATVSELLEELTILSEGYFGDGIVPDLAEESRRLLYATLMSHLPKEAQPICPEPHSDNRGSLVEIIRMNTAGRVFFSTTKPGIRRGEHYHTRLIERFCVVRGSAVIRIRAVGGGEVIEHHVTGDNPQFITIPAMHTHHIENTGSDELLTLFWGSDLFDPANPDTYFEKVLVEEQQTLREAA